MTEARSNRPLGSGRPPGVLAVRFIGVRTDRFEETVAVYRDALGLAPIHEVRRAPPGSRSADGTQVHVYGPPDDDHDVLRRLRRASATSSRTSPPLGPAASRRRL